MASATISVHGLRKAYGGTEVVRGIDFEVAAGEGLRLPGPQRGGEDHDDRDPRGLPGTHARRGLRPRGGPGPSHASMARAGGARSPGVRARPVAHRHRDAEALLGVLLGPPPGLRDLDLVGLDEKRDARAGTLSGGQRRRLDVAVALVGRPELVFLDEPTTGFDPSARREAWTMIEGLKAEGPPSS